MARRSTTLASDADRESVAERLRQAATEGRILAHELEERLARALRARTYGELDLLVDDLPRSGSPAQRGSTAFGLARSHPVAAVVVLVMAMLTIVVAAAVLAAFAFSGLGFVFVILALARFGPWSRGGGPRGRYGYGAKGYDGSQRGRSPHWVR